MPNLDKGDFVYQSDQELFLVVIGEDEDTYRFAVHGWRNIGKERLDEYIDHQNGKLYRQEHITELVETEGDQSTQEHYSNLQELFSAYSEIELKENGPHTDFTLEDN